MERNKDAIIHIHRPFLANLASWQLGRAICIPNGAVVVAYGELCVGMRPTPFSMSLLNTINIGRIERGLVLMCCVSDVIRGY